MRQQQRLFDKPRIKLHALIHESILQREIGQEQIFRLIELADLRNVTIQVVPQSTKMPPGLSGSAVILSFDDADEPDVAFTDTLVELVEIQEKRRVGIVRNTLRRLEATALSPQATVSLLKETT
ncbi:hypothetical protein DMH04_47555 [Kibdelosporangium aridum]|uniref:DUF5753 domain-containing protein n=2 Tax=Kibdelosporangium aridum TaxID=2030 RepID=A0A428YKN9_KIBAR|nr:hypothetical protein DMH04_47555 [Kibdelosporangium aridum]